MPVSVAPVKLALVAVLLLIITLVSVAPRKSALLYVPEFIWALAKLAVLKFAPVRSRFERFCPRKSHPLKSTPTPRALQLLLMAWAGMSDRVKAPILNNTMSTIIQRREGVLPSACIESPFCITMRL